MTTTTAQRIAVPVKDEPVTAPPTTPAVIRSAFDGNDLDDLIAVGLALHLFTEIVRHQVDLSPTDLHRATTVLSKQMMDTLTRHNDHDALRAVLRLVTDPEREAHPDGRAAAELCGEAWPAVRTAAYDRAEQNIKGATDFGVVSMLRLAATRAVAQQAPWWGTPEWRARLTEFVTANPSGPLEHLTLGSAPELAPEASLKTIIA
jgi:hypothetical protein